MATVGVLALQGDVQEHRAVLERLGASVQLVRTPAELDRVDGLVLPGGESTTLAMLLDSSSLREPLVKRLQAGMPALGTCAGMILLATTIVDGRPDQYGLAAIDITVRRNAFGRQRESFEAVVVVDGLTGPPMHVAFIRAPVVEAVGPNVRVLATIERGDGKVQPVVCRAGAVTVAAFHPELTGEDRLHRMLLDDL